MMFYTQLFTSKRGPLARIWLAAHWERKITKAMVFDCNLEVTVKDILSPKMKISLRTSSHLLLGVVRIYSRKIKYLLADCNNSLVKIQLAFMPDQTDLPLEGLEAPLKDINLTEDFKDFETELPHPNDIDVVDHFSLNQSRVEEITLQEDFGNDFLSRVDFENQSQCQTGGMLDVSFQSLGHRGDSFGDENTGLNLLDFMMNSSDTVAMELVKEMSQNENEWVKTLNKSNHQQDGSELGAMAVEPRTLNEATLLGNAEKGLALQPVAVTRRNEKRKRRLVVDQTKELSNEAIKDQLADSSDLVAPLDMAPPTRQLMQWMENGGGDQLFGQLCSVILNPQIQQLFTKSAFRLGSDAVCEEGGLEQMRTDREEVQNTRFLSPENRGPDESLDPETTRNHAEHIFDIILDGKDKNCSDMAKDDSMMDISHPGLPSEDPAMFVQLSFLGNGSESTVVRTQSMLDSQDSVERRMTKRVLKLLNFLKTQSTAIFSLEALCKRGSRSHAATTFFCLLVLKKQKALNLKQDGPYADIVATPGPRFHDLCWICN